MKFFIDTANIEEIKEANSMGMADGVTTNPTLIAREKGNFEDIIKEICKIVDGPI
ncbi:MAG: fructose-6-phosphate aldolase, partial [Desulfobacterales bacterium]|nr:fructose-6-phosphate aldolase [Desulfobacterales bacterium]